jgi:hypothetical protein
MTSPSVPGRLREWIPETTLLLATTGAGLWAGGRWLDPSSDPGIWWSLPERLASGECLYRDLYLQYGPLSVHLFSRVVRLFDGSLRCILLLNWIPAVLAGILLLRAARPFLSTLERLCLCAILLGVCLFAPGAGRVVFPYCPGAVHALCFSLAALILVGEDADGRARIRDYGAGVLTGMAFCAKQEIGVAAIVGLVAAALLPAGGPRRAARTLAGFAAFAALGAAVVLSSAPLESLRLDSHVWPLAAAPPPEWRTLFRMIAGIGPGLPSRLLGSARGLVLFACLFGFVGLLLARERRMVRLLPVGAALAALLVWDVLDRSLWRRNLGFFHLWMTLAFAVALLAFLDRRRERRAFLVGLGLFAGIVGSRSAFSGDIGNPYAGVAHLPGALTFVLFLFVFLPGLVPGGAEPARLTRRVWAIALLPIVTLGAWIGILNLRAPGHRAVETLRGRVWVAKEEAAVFERLAKELRPGERVLVVPEINAVDDLFRAASASPFLTHMPGWLDRRGQEILIHRLESAPPDVIVVFARPTWEYGVAPFGQGFGLVVADWIARHGRTVYESEGGTILRTSTGAAQAAHTAQPPEARRE